MYFAVSVSEPAASDPAGIVMDAEPELRVVEADVKVPLERTTEPFGVPLAPETAIVTLRLCAVVMLLEAAVTVTAGVTGPDGELPPLLLPHPLIRKTTLINPIKKRNRDFM